MECKREEDIISNMPADVSPVEYIACVIITTDSKIYK